jgi:hypothetical protein
METLVDYALSAFPNTSFNTSVLADQIAAATAVGRRLSFVTLTGATVSLAFPGPVVGAAKTALDAVVAAHQGQAYGPSTQSAQAMGQQSNDTTGDVAAVALPLLPLQTGPYLFTWICELAPTSNVANTGARVALQSNISGSFVDHFEQNMGAPAVAGTFWSVFTGSVIATIGQAGATPTLRLVWRRMGGTSNPSLIRRARIAIAPAS